jgi:hypothetical protein
VSKNPAKGGADGLGASNGVEGQGIGGGVFLAGPGSSHTPAFVVSGNQASTADNHIFGSF